MRVMQHAPEKQNGEDGLPIPPYKVYNIGNSHPENLLEFVSILQEELVRAGVNWLWLYHCSRANIRR